MKLEYEPEQSVIPILNEWANSIDGSGISTQNPTEMQMLWHHWWQESVQLNPFSLEIVSVDCPPPGLETIPFKSTRTRYMPDELKIACERVMQVHRALVFSSAMNTISGSFKKLRDQGVEPAIIQAPTSWLRMVNEIEGPSSERPPAHRSRFPVSVFGCPLVPVYFTYQMGVMSDPEIGRWAPLF